MLAMPCSLISVSHISYLIPFNWSFHHTYVADVVVVVVVVVGWIFPHFVFIQQSAVNVYIVLLCGMFKFVCFVKERTEFQPDKFLQVNEQIIYTKISDLCLSNDRWKCDCITANICHCLDICHSALYEVFRVFNSSNEIYQTVRCRATVLTKHYIIIFAIIVHTWLHSD